MMMMQVCLLTSYYQRLFQAITMAMWAARTRIEIHHLRLSLYCGLSLYRSLPLYCRLPLNRSLPLNLHLRLWHLWIILKTIVIILHNLLLANTSLILDFEWPRGHIV